MTRRPVLLATAVSAALLAGCGGGSGSSKSDNGTSASSAVSSSAELTKLFKGIDYQAPPKSGPKPVAGKKVWVLSCGQSITNCSIAANAAMDAGKKLGWEMTLYDTKFSSSRIAEAIDQAIAVKADGIMAYLIDCSLAKQPLEKARAAGVKTSAAESVNCESGGYDALVSYSQGEYLDWLNAYGEMQGRVTALATGGKAKVILLKIADVPTAVVNWEANQRGLATCDGCSVAATVSFTNLETGSVLQQKVQQALVQHPEANAIITPADAYLNGGVLGALRATNRLDKVFIGLGEGDPTTMEAFKSGQLKNAVGVGIPEAWEAYQAMDNLNRLFAGEAPASSGIGLQAFDAEHNATHGTGAYDPSVDWQAGYKKLWSRK